MGTSIESCSKLYLAVWKDEQCESICGKCWLCARQLKMHYKKSVEKFNENVFCIKV